MKNFLNLLFLFMIVVLGVVIGLTSLNEVYTANTAGCVIFNGSLTNCSMSDYAYNQQEKAVTQAGIQYQFMGYSNYVLAIGVLAAALFLIVAVIRKR